MPLYEYTCRTCGAEVELLVRESDARPRCPTCGSLALKRKFSTFSSRVRSATTSSACASGACSLAGSSCSTGGCASGACPLG